MEYLKRYSNFPASIMTLSGFQDVTDSNASLINRIKDLRRSGKYAEANQLINNNAAIIKKMSINAQWVNKMEEELINAQIFAIKNQQQVYIQTTEPEAEENDIWLQEY